MRFFALRPPQEGRTGRISLSSLKGSTEEALSDGAPTSLIILNRAATQKARHAESTPRKPIMYDWPSIEQHMSECLQADLVLRVVQGDPEELELTAGEHQQLASISNSARRQSWLRARQALKQTLMERGLSTDTSRITFPNEQHSLSHTQDIAVAVCLTGRRGLGVGVDIERVRDVKPGADRFFLSDAERTWLSNITDRNLRQSEFVRLWTIKESIYKSDFLQQDGVLKNYCIQDCSSLTGEARHTHHVEKLFSYASTQIGDYFLTVAISLK